MREIQHRYDVEDYARQLARDTVADYIEYTDPDTRDYYELLDQLAERVDGCEAVIYPYNAAMVVLFGRSSEFIQGLPRTGWDEDWSDYTQRCAYMVLIDIAHEFIGEYYDAAKPYQTEEQDK